MTKTDRRQALLETLAEHLLSHGLAGASLRPMAAAAGTSDRMLLYYFADREALLAATLELVAARLAAALEGTVPPAPLPFAELLRRLRAPLRDPALGRYMHLFLDIAARAARDERPYRAIGEAIGRGFLAWAELRVAGGPAEAALLLATLDGLTLLDNIGLGDEADSALGVVG